MKCLEFIDPDNDERICETELYYYFPCYMFKNLFLEHMNDKNRYWDKYKDTIEEFKF